MDALLCCLHMQCPCQQNTLYVQFIKNNVLKLHRCFNLRFVAPNQVQNPSTEVIYKQKNQWWRSWTRKYTQFTSVMILVLKNVAGRACVPLPALPVYLHMYTQQGLLQPTADDSPVLRGKMHGKYFGHLFSRNAHLETGMKVLSGADGSVWPPQCTRQRHQRWVQCSKKGWGLRNLQLKLQLCFRTQRTLGQREGFGLLFPCMLMKSFSRGISNSNSLSF